MPQSRSSGTPEPAIDARAVTVLRALGAAFDDPQGEIVGPFHFDVGEKERISLEAASPRAASIAARMCAAIVKPTRGIVYVGDYDTRLQPAQAKRRLGFVDVAGFLGNAHAFACEIAFRADVWNLDRSAAQRRVRTVLASLGVDDEPYARAVALALVADVKLVVLDQPASDVAPVLRDCAPALTIVETRVARVAPALTR